MNLILPKVCQFFHLYNHFISKIVAFNAHNFDFFLLLQLAHFINPLIYLLDFNLFNLMNQIGLIFFKDHFGLIKVIITNY